MNGPTLNIRMVVRPNANRGTSEKKECHLTSRTQEKNLWPQLQPAPCEPAAAYNLEADPLMQGWIRALEEREYETAVHCRRVVELTARLAVAMGLDEKELIHIRRGALLHDIGKMGIPDHILLKPGPLTETEWEIMRMHPVYAYRLIAPVAYLAKALDIPYCHHEKWDGTGYPRGLKGESIPLSARIFSVIDVYDALTSERPYNHPWPVQEVRAYLLQQSGRYFDPRVVEVFLLTF